MNNLIFLGIVLLMLTCCGVCAENLSGANATAGPVAGSSSLSTEGSHALIQILGIDHALVSDAYGYLVTGNVSKKDWYSYFANDTGGTVDRYLTTLESSAGDDTALEQFYSAWDVMNATGVRMMATYEQQNKTPAGPVVEQYATDVADFNTVQDLLISRYIDKNTLDAKTLFVLLHIDLIQGINDWYAFSFTRNPADKDDFMNRIALYDNDTALFNSRFPNESVRNLTNLRDQLEGGVTGLLAKSEKGQNLTPDDWEQLNLVIDRILESYGEAAYA